MKIRNIALGLALTAAVGASASADARMDAFVDSLLSQMTLDEKIGQLHLPVGADIVTGDIMNSDIGGDIAAGRVGGVFNMKGCDKIREYQRIAVEESRLGIPLIFGMDVIHGYETVMPIPFALSCSWDMDAIERSARIAAREASAAGICWTFSPMVDISREPRWGRMAEGSGEDPYLGARIAEAMVRGYQGDSMKANDEIMACVKHFALYGAPEGGRDYNTVDMSRQRMFNEYFEPYRAAAAAGAGSFMTSFNTVDGVPATGNRWLFTDVLRDMWDFDGFVVTDYGAIPEMMSHGMGGPEDVTALALNAGIDMDMAGMLYLNVLRPLVEQGRVFGQQIDNAVRRILEAKYRLGLFENPYKYIDPAREASEIYTAENRAAARAMAPETFVLLKNEGSLLPLAKNGRIALVGPLADAGSHMQGMWSVAADPSKYRSLRQAFADALEGRAPLSYAKGSNLYADPELEAAVSIANGIRDPRSEAELLEEALAVADGADVIVAALGEGIEGSGESASRADLTLPDTQMRLLQALVATGKPVVLLNFSGRPTVMVYEQENVPAIMNVWFGGSEAADAIADVVFGDAAPSGKLTATMPRNVGQIPLYYNHLNTGRPRSDGPAKFEKYRSNYIDSPVTPLYPFGYGLTYTTFAYGDPVLSAPEMNADGSVTVTVPVTNTGSREGTEIVQLYIRDLAASVARPVKELKRFARVTIAPGQTENVTFTLGADDLKFYNSDLDFVLEPGDFDIMTGPSSADVRTVRLTVR
ncbi:MAG: beta-glucosidase BglX [Muribaculaceae bacterium]|nr:beta-glucosidase BglX [Muribaculaceae bacterium]